MGSSTGTSIFDPGGGGFTWPLRTTTGLASGFFSSSGIHARYNTPGIEQMERRTAVFLARADDDAVGLAGSCALGAVAMGDRVDIFLLGEAVRAVVLGAEDEGASRLLRQARAAGARIFACSQSTVAARLDTAAVESALDAVVGWPTILEWTRGVSDRFFF
jgi:predicted peroxiredoxin